MDIEKLQNELDEKEHKIKNQQRSILITTQALRKVHYWSTWQRIKHVFGFMDVLTIPEE